MHQDPAQGDYRWQLCTRPREQLSRWAEDTGLEEECLLRKTRVELMSYLKCLQRPFMKLGSKFEAELVISSRKIKKNHETKPKLPVKKSNNIFCGSVVNNDPIVIIKSP